MNNDIQKELVEELKWVKNRIRILDMIEERLLKMRELAQYVVDNELEDSEKQEINKKVQLLQEQINLLNSKNNNLIN